MPRKQKQRQKQKQEQYVVVNVHEKKSKKRKPNRKKGTLPPPVVLGLPKVPPIVVQYTEPASLGQPPPPTSAAVIAQEPVKPKVFNEPRKVLQEPDWVKPVAKAPVVGRGKEVFPVEPVRPSSDVLRGAPPSLAEIIGRQSRADTPQYQPPIAEAFIAQGSSGGGSIRYPRPRSHGTEIPVERLASGDFGETATGKKRNAPTSAQKKLLEKSGYSGNPPWK